MPSGASKDSLKEYVKSIAAPGTNTANIFGLKSWMSSSRGGETSVPLLENEDGAHGPDTAGGDNTWMGSSTSNFLGLVSTSAVCHRPCDCAGGVVRTCISSV